MLFLPLPWVDWPPLFLLPFFAAFLILCCCFCGYLLSGFSASQQLWMLGSISGGGAPFLSALTTGTEPWKPRTCCWVAKLHQCFPLSSPLLHLGLPTFFSQRIFHPGKSDSQPVCKQNMEAPRNWGSDPHVTRFIMNTKPEPRGKNTHTDSCLRPPNTTQVAAGGDIKGSRKLSAA